MFTPTCATLGFEVMRMSTVTKRQSSRYYALTKTTRRVATSKNSENSEAAAR